MKSPSMKVGMFLLLVFIFIATLNLWSLRPVNIIHASSKTQGGSAIVVDHFPYTDRDRIYWYLDHRKELQDIYGVPAKDKYSILIFGLGEGFFSAEENYKLDLYCFTDMYPKNNCIEKNLYLEVRMFKYGGEVKKEVFEIGYSGYSYTVGKEGKLVAGRDEELYQRMHHKGN